jgi:hypothetical protein
MPNIFRDFGLFRYLIIIYEQFINSVVRTANPTFQKRGVLKDPADYRPASSSYPVKTLQRDDDALGPSDEHVRIFMFNSTTNI